MIGREIRERARRIADRFAREADRTIACVLDAASWTVEDAASLRRWVVRLLDHADELCGMEES